MNDQQREAFEKLLRVLGPTVPECSGCHAEWSEALRIVNEALTQPQAQQNRRIEVLRAERDHARAVNENLVKALTSIHTLINPLPVEHDGKTYTFVNPHANETLQALSDQIRAIPDKIQEYGLAQQAAAVPPGFKLVPVEPTSEMLDRGHHQIDFDRDGQNTEKLVDASHFDENGVGTSIETDMRDAWAAMLAAAPPAPVLPLSDEQIESLLVNWPKDGIAFIDFARAIEASHGITEPGAGGESTT